MNKDLPERALTGSQPDRDGRPMSPDLQAHIGLRLKAFYDSVLSEPIPDRFAQLLDRLDSAEATGAAAGQKAAGAAGSAAGDDAPADQLNTIGSDARP